MWDSIYSLFSGSRFCADVANNNLTRSTGFDIYDRGIDLTNTDTLALQSVGYCLVTLTAMTLDSSGIIIRIKEG